ncbi:unnamed protein product [Echinostoma caproni]|uniref:Uncharacterized protein n=1 Tax=Echinostoma caproni TaxID=27848 RepID=A0A3P8LAI5_9TREM|nr:unnamed protein product [Echinostoma caproni]
MRCPPVKIASDLYYVHLDQWIETSTLGVAEEPSGLIPKQNDQDSMRPTIYSPQRAETTDGEIAARFQLGERRYPSQVKSALYSSNVDRIFREKNVIAFALVCALLKMSLEM